MNLFEAIRFWRRTRPKPEFRRRTTAWDSMVVAASEEWGDETVFTFVPPLSWESCQALVRVIGDAAMAPPVDLDALKLKIARRFGISRKNALTAIDRALGGFCRGAARYEGAIPDPVIDPIGAAACELASHDDELLDEIYGNWRNWRPDCHSSPEDHQRYAKKSASPEREP